MMLSGGEVAVKLAGSAAKNAAAMLLMAAGFGVRWKYYIEAMNAGWLLAFPVSTFYESASFFLLALLAAFFFTTCLKRRPGGPGRLTPGTARGEALAWCAVDFLAGIGILALSLTGISSDPVLFLPSLRSYWLMAHVCLSFVAYGMFALAAILAVLVLCRAENREENAARIRALVRASAESFSARSGRRPPGGGSGPGTPRRRGPSSRGAATSPSSTLTAMSSSRKGGLPCLRSSTSLW